MDLNAVITWLSENKEWVFEGIGVAFLGWIGLLFYRSKNDSSQNQTSGSNSINNQSSGNINQNINIKR